MDKILLDVLSIVLSLGVILITTKILTTEQASSLDWYLSTAFSAALTIVVIIRNKRS